MWYGSSISRALFVALALLVLVIGAFALRVAWERIPEAEAQVDIQQPGPIQSEASLRELSPASSIDT
jgi:hypothetical protein